LKKKKKTEFTGHTECSPRWLSNYSSVSCFIVW